jgi:hypothetical protein
MQVHDDHDAIQPSPDDLPVIDIRRLWVLRSAPPNGPLRRRPAHSEKKPLAQWRLGKRCHHESGAATARTEPHSELIDGSPHATGLGKCR